MNISFPTRTGVVLIAALASSLLQAVPLQNPGVSARPESTSQQVQADAAAQYTALPLRFEPNVGQTDRRVQFLARASGYTLFLTANESVMLFARPVPAVMPTSSEGPVDAIKRAADASVAKVAATAVVRMRFVGANKQPRLTGVDPLPGISNYFIGNVPADWHRDIVSFAKVRYGDIYPGIDLVYYGRGRTVEYDFVLKPGADPSAIRLKFDGPKHLAVNAAGELVLKLAGGELRQPAAVIYQQGPDGPVLVSGNYVVRGNEIGFAIADYDRSRPLIIDPAIVYSTYLGGSGFDQANAIHVGTTGDAYVVGVTASADFPIEGVPTSAFGGGQDVFVTKMSLAGSTLTYSTYIGGIGNDIGNDIVVSGAGTAYITGSTDSINYPVVTPTIAAQVGGTDAFLTKLTSGGNGIVYSTYWGSTGFEEGTGVTVDPADNAYICGNTSAPDFPTQTPFQAALAGGMDAFMTKFSVAGNSIVYSTYLGGAGDDRATDMTVADDAAVFVVGSTTSANFPTTAASVQPALAGGRDAFLTHFSLAGNALLYSTFLGGPGDDEAFGIVIDAPMNAYLTGRTNSQIFPTLNPAQEFFGGGLYDAFVARINPPGTALVYSTYLGGSGDDQGHGIAIDGALNTFVTGGTTSADFPTRSAYQSALMGPSDAFVTKLMPTGASMVYSTYLGGSAADEGRGIGIDLVGSAYVTGFTESPNFPILAPFQAGFGAVRDAFVTKLVDVTAADFIFADGFEGTVVAADR
jgi:hypothetical protein